MKKIYKIFTIVACAALFTACDNELNKSDYDCKADSSKLPVVKTGDVKGNYGIGLKLSMKVESNNDLDTVMQQGVLVGTSENLTLISGTVYPAETYKIGAEQVVVLKDLLPQTDYYYCAYAQNRDGVAYGEKKIIKTDKEWNKVPVVYENFSNTSFLDNLFFLNLGAEDGFNFFKATPSWKLTNGASFVAVMFSVNGETGGLFDADDLIECEADFTDGVFPEFKFLPFSYGAKPVQSSDLYFDSFEVIASSSPIKTKEQADAAKVYYSTTLNKDNVNKMHTVSLNDFENQICYIAIRHKAEKAGYALMISHVEANALFAPIE